MLISRNVFFLDGISLSSISISSSGSFRQFYHDNRTDLASEFSHLSTKRIFFFSNCRWFRSDRRWRRLWASSESVPSIWSVQSSVEIDQWRRQSLHSRIEYSLKSGRRIPVGHIKNFFCEKKSSYWITLVFVVHLKHTFLTIKINCDHFGFVHSPLFVTFSLLIFSWHWNLCLRLILLRR